VDQGEVLQGTEVSHTFEMVETGNAFLSCELTERQPGRLLFDVGIDEAAPSGDIFGKVAFCFDHPEFPSIEARVVGRKVGCIKAIPSRISVWSQAGVPLAPKVQVRSVDERSFRIVDIECPEGVAAELDADATEADREAHTLTVYVEADRLSKDNACLVVHSTQPECRVLKIPVVLEGT
jgi:hypothetical protein